MSGSGARISRVRVVVGGAGGLLMALGAFRLGSEIPAAHLLALAGWLVGALVLHDAVLSPAVVGVGVALRTVPPRARTHLQGALVAGGIVTLIAVPMIYRADRQPGVKALLEQDFVANLAVLLGLVAAIALVSYSVRVARQRHTAGAAEGSAEQPAEDRTSRSDRPSE